jgi:hypothetical protein
VSRKKKEKQHTLQLASSETHVSVPAQHSGSGARDNSGGKRQTRTSRTATILLSLQMLNKLKFPFLGGIKIYGQKVAITPHCCHPQRYPHSHSRSQSQIYHMGPFGQLDLELEELYAVHEYRWAMVCPHVGVYSHGVCFAFGCDNSF